MKKKNYVFPMLKEFKLKPFDVLAQSNMPATSEDVEEINFEW